MTRAWSDSNGIFSRLTPVNLAYNQLTGTAIATTTLRTDTTIPGEIRS